MLFAREGSDEAIVCLSFDVGTKETQRHVEAEGGRCPLLRGDVKGHAVCHQALQNALDAFGQLGVLVSHAAFQMHAE